MKKPTKEIKQKYVTEATFEKHMRSIAHSFDGLGKGLENLTKAVTGLAQHMNIIKEDMKDMKGTLSSFVSDVNSHERRIENLTVRVERLEEARK